MAEHDESGVTLPEWHMQRRRDAAEIKAAQQAVILQEHQDELTPLLVAAQDIERHTMRRPSRLLLPAPWGLDSQLVNGGSYFGYQLLIVVGLDRPMLGYTNP